MTAIQTFRKDPDAELDYSIDWSDWLASAEVIDSVAWDVPSGITSELEVHSDDVATIWLSGGDVGETYSIGCRVTTSDDRIDDRTIDVVVEER